MLEEKQIASFVTFYSFKGGVGRSMALINTAGNLAGRGFRVLVIDLDLEAPGLSYLNPDESAVPFPNPSQKELFVQSGFVDLLTDAKEKGENSDLFSLSLRELSEKYTRAYAIPNELCDFPGGALHIMPAGKFDGQYAKRFDVLNLHDLYQKGLGEPLIRAFKKKFSEGNIYDYVLIDSRTGFSDEAGICTRDLADYLMILSGLNRQNIEGTCDFLRALRATKGENETNFTIILSPVPNGEDALLDRREEIAKSSFESAWEGKIDLSIQIPYHPQLSLTEEPHIFRRRKGPLFEAYRTIERRVLVGLGHDASVLRPKIFAMLKAKFFQEALAILPKLVRYEGGRMAISHLSAELSQEALIAVGLKAGKKNEPEKSVIDTMREDIVGRKVIEFLVGHLKMDSADWGGKQLLEYFKGTDPDWAYILFKKWAATGEANNPGQMYAYASFLAEQGRDLDEAETYFRRLIELMPDPAFVGSFAIFLERKRGRFEEAEVVFKEAIAKEPLAKSSEMAAMSNYCNFGQFLLGSGRLEEAKENLLNSYSKAKMDDAPNIAEVALSLWITLELQDDPTSKKWEGNLKYLYPHDFRRPKWEFDRVLQHAAKLRDSEWLRYARALVEGFLDFEKVSNLDSFDRWKVLTPLKPVASLAALRDAQ